MKNVITFHKSVIPPAPPGGMSRFQLRPESWVLIPSSIFSARAPRGSRQCSVQLYPILNSVHDIVIIEISATTTVPTRLWTHSVPHKQPSDQYIRWWSMYLMTYQCITTISENHKRVKCSVLCLLLWCVGFTYLNVSGHQNYRNKEKKRSPQNCKKFPPN